MVTVVFFLLELLPGDVLDALDAPMEDERTETLRDELGLSDPTVVRFARYVAGLARGDWGRSLRTGRTVRSLVARRLPYTMILAVTAFAATLLIGGAVGLAAGLRPRSFTDRLLRLSIGVIAGIPAFWVALLLVGLFAVRLRWMPVFGVGTPRHLILPTLTAAMPLVPGTARQVRAAVIEVRRRDFLVVARAKGLGRATILRRHTAPALLAAVLNYWALQVIHLVSGVAVIEAVFGRPGLASLAVDAALGRDGPVLLGAVIAFATVTVVLIAVIDLALPVVDPMRRVSRRTSSR